MNSAFFRLSVPPAVKAVPLRARRVGQDAVEHVHAARDQLEHLRRRAQAHRVARFVRGQMRLAPFDRLHHLRFRFAHAHSADGVAVEIHRGQRLRARAPQIFKGSSLHDPENRSGEGGAKEFFRHRSAQRSVISRLRAA